MLRAEVARVLHHSRSTHIFGLFREPDLCRGRFFEDEEFERIAKRRDLQ